MTQPWLDDATSLLEALRAGTLSAREATESVLDALRSSALNAVSYVDEERALAAADGADLTLPLGGLPLGVKELEPVAKWPLTEASVPLVDEIADEDAPMIERLRAAGSVLVAQTTSSEFGNVNYTSTKLHGTTTNPWDPTATPGGSSGGTAAAVAGGLLPLATGSDGGGSIRIPAGFSGLVGLKPTFGRIPKTTESAFEPLTAVLGCLARSIRDSALFLDATAGPDERDPFSLPAEGSFVDRLGTHSLEGLRVGIDIDLGVAVVAEDVEATLTETAERLIAATGMTRVPLELSFPEGGFEWSMVGAAVVLTDLGDRYPACADELGFEMAFGAKATVDHFSLATFSAVERFRRAATRAMALAFDQVDLIICATNPDVAFEAAGPMRTVIDGRDLVKELGFGKALGNNGALTIPANTTGNPSLAVPAGLVRGLPVSLQIMGRHHTESLLLDVGLALERLQPWPLVAPGSPH